MIAKGMTVLMLMAALALAGCGGGQPASNESASAKKAGASIQKKSDSSAAQKNDSGSQESGSKDSMAATSDSSDKMDSREKSGDSMATASAGPVGDMIEIRKPWVRVRAEPNNEASPIGVAYGNDTYPVLEQDGDWVKVRFNKSQQGWVPVSATQE